MANDIPVALISLSIAYLVYLILTGKLVESARQDMRGLAAASIFCGLSLLVKLQTALDGPIATKDIVMIAMLVFGTLLYPSIRLLERVKPSA